MATPAGATSFRAGETDIDMLAPFAVDLRPYDPAWVDAAGTARRALLAQLQPTLVEVHHIGSTSIPGMAAKPILDLLPVTRDLAELDGLRTAIESLGYVWWGEYGLPGRRYLTRSDPETGRRLGHFHCYEIGTPEIDRHLAFRDYLRAHGDIARDYEREKRRCQRLHPAESDAYADCKSARIEAVERAALAWRGSR